MVYFDMRRVSSFSSVSISILADLGGLLKVVRILLLVPSFIRDPLYKLISKNRYNFFGKLDKCRVPDDSQKDFFLN